MTDYYVQFNGVGPVSGPCTWQNVKEFVRDMKPGEKIEVRAELSYPEDV